ncbi:MAG TPA: hypothetical protein VMD04_05130 [Candidatus Margulisiibacteriota bacterium]|nr:hypothetical protein [Candidatus Margulisiibacteriota bacterium]
MCKLLDDILKVAVWKNTDDFPYDLLAQAELEKWLRYAQNKDWLTEYLPRLTKMNINNRDEALNEIFAAYFLEEKMHLTVREREPVGANGKRGEFIIVANGVGIFCEVKSPGPESEIVEKEGVGSPRLSQGKYLPNEARWGDDSKAVRQVVNKTYKKLPNDKPSLLIIVDDFWRDLFEIKTFEITVNKSLYYESRTAPYEDSPSGCFAAKDYEKLGGVLFLKLQKRNNTFIYNNRLCLNKYALFQLLPALRGTRLDSSSM